MLRKLLCFLLMLIFSFQVIAAPIANDRNIQTVMAKYDYLLTSHPQAHEKEFQKKVMEKFKVELSAIVANSSPDELNTNIDIVLSKLPTQEMRDSYKKRLDNISQENIANILSQPNFLENSLRGESANFFLDSDAAQTAGLVLIIGLVTAGIIALIIDGIERGKYQWFEASGGNTCNGTSTYTQQLKEDLKESARTKCLSGATHPETCTFDGFYTDDYISEDHHGEYWASDCVAKYKAKKELE